MHEIATQRWLGLAGHAHILTAQNAREYEHFRKGTRLEEQSMNKPQEAVLD